MFSEKDIKQLVDKGITPEMVEFQINNFKRGFDFVELDSPATPKNGLLVLKDQEANEMVQFFDEEMKDLSALKFVPASGAASRMFKSLFEFLESYRNGIPVDQLLADKSFNSPANFFEKLSQFAFYDELIQVLKENGFYLTQLLHDERYDIILDFFLTEKGLNYGNLPKGLLRFHKYSDGNRLALEEHFLEGINYAASSDGIVKMHFTVSSEHEKLFADAFNVLIPKYEAQTGLKFDISTSIQKPSTDTIAVDMNNLPFRNADSSLLFRPAGHGALIENLNDLDEDVIFIKNIDNIVPDNLRADTIFYKKMIGGLMLHYQNIIFNYLDMLDIAEIDSKDFEEMKSFIENKLHNNVINGFDNMSEIERIDFLFTYFNRPIRVCGMVKNEGEPGGGPFKVNDRGDITLQIVEGSQIDMENEKQIEILKQSTHFNPVDLVCGVRDFYGNKFNLLEFIDPDTGFISVKSKDGRDLKAQELPGLWNGAMADWITVFVEVPISTFNPVKTINDLLRPQHQ